MAIAARLTSEIRGYSQAIRNAMDGQALIDTAEGALDEVVNMLQRARQIAVQSSNDTNDTDDRAALDIEFQAILAEIARVADSTTWAGQKLFDQSGGGKATPDGTFEFLVGTGASATVTTDTISHQIFDLTAAATITTQGDDVLTQAKAKLAILALDVDIKAVNEERANLGAVSNRLDSTVKNLTNVVTNLEAGRGRIEDADFAAETTNLAKSQILQQAAMAMLAQANASKQGVLSLLQR